MRALLGERETPVKERQRSRNCTSRVSGRLKGKGDTCETRQHAVEPCSPMSRPRSALNMDTVSENGVQAPSGKGGSQWFEPTTLDILSTINNTAATAHQAAAVHVCEGVIEWEDRTYVMVKDERPPVMWLCMKNVEEGKEAEEEIRLCTDNKTLRLPDTDKSVCMMSLRSNPACLRSNCYLTWTWWWKILPFRPHETLILDKYHYRGLFISPKQPWLPFVLWHHLYHYFR